MAVNVMWEDEQKKVLLLIFEAHWTLQEFDDAVKRSYDMMDTVDYIVNLIIDLRNGRELPGGFIGGLRKVSKTPHPNHGLMVLIGVNAFVRAVYDVFSKLYPGKASERSMRIAADYDEAHAMFAHAARPDLTVPPEEQQGTHRL